MRIENELTEGWLQVIALTGELDAYTAPELQQAVSAALAEGAPWLIVDLGKAEYIDSVGLGILIGGVKRAAESGGDLAVACARRNVRKVFEVSGTAEMLNVVDDVPQAIAALSARRAVKASQGAAPQGGEAE